MSEFIQDHKQLLEVIDGQAPLLITFGLTGEEHDTYTASDTHYGSNTFNAYTRACYLLRKSPEAALVTEKISTPAQLSTVGRHLINLINDSVSRDRQAPYNFENKSAVKSRATCFLSEDRFVRAAEQAKDTNRDERQLEFNRLYVDSEGQPIFYKKGLEASCAVSFEEIALNGIRFPAGTLFSLKKIPRRFRDGEQYNDDSVVHPLEDIGKIAPLRMSRFNLPDEEKIPALVDSKSYSLYGTIYIDQVIRYPHVSLDDLRAMLPTQQELADMVQDQSEPAAYNNSAWVPKPTFAT